MNADSLDIRLLRFRSRRDEPAHALAQALLEAQRHGEALEVIQAGLQDGEEDPRLLVLAGRTWFEQGDLPQAQGVLLRAIKSHPNDRESYRWLAQVLMKRGEPARAVQVLDRALSIDPNDKPLQQARARAERLARIVVEDPAPEPVAPPELESGVPDRFRGHPSPVVSAPPPRIPPPPMPRSQEPGPARGASQSAEPRAARSAEPMMSSTPAPAAAKSAEPIPARAAAKSAEPIPARAAAKSAEPIPARPAAKSAEPIQSRPPGKSAEPMYASASRSAQPMLGGPPANTQKPVSASASRSAQPIVAGNTAPARDLLVQAPDDAFDTDTDTMPPRGNAALTAALEEDDEDAFESSGTGRLNAADLYGEEEEEDNDDFEPTMMRSHHDVLSEAEDFNKAAQAFSEPVAERVESYETAPSYEKDIATEIFDTPPSADAEPPEQVLDLLAKQGIFEDRAQGGSAWVSKKEAPRDGNRLGVSLAVGWVLALAAAGGGYYAFNRWVEQRHKDAGVLIAQAVADVRDGQYESLLSSERRLRKAHDFDPKSQAALEALLVTHGARALEDATGDVGYLRATVAHAEKAKLSPALVAAGKALIGAYDRNVPVATSQAEQALKLAPNDARVLYLMGRLYQRSGRPEAQDLLARATTQDAGLSLAWLAQAEIARQDGERERALELLDKSLGEDHANLRAELWSIVLATGLDPAEDVEKRLDALNERVKRGAASDKLLAAIARGGVLLEKGDLEGAKAAVAEAAKLRVQDPELMSLLGERAASVGEHELAYRAANAALVAAPSVRRYRDALANVLLKRGDGRAVLTALEGIQDTGAWLLITRARASLLAGSRDALEQSKKALASYRNSEEGKDDVDAGALLVRTDLQLGANPESLITAARSLAQKAPTSPMAQLALGEVAVHAGQADLAVTALERARKLAPEDADAYTLLGRAYRLSGKPDKAQASLERALVLSPSHPAARAALGGLLLDRGEFDRALKLFTNLERERGSLSATLGMVEADIGLGDGDAAEKLLVGLDADTRALPPVQVLTARLALLRGKPTEAVHILEPLVDEESEVRSAEVLALYGDALYAGDRVDPAAGAYEAALELDPTHPDALVGRAMAAVRAEKYSQAYELLEQAKVALEQRARPPKVRANLLLAWGKADIAKENYSRAKTMLAEAIALPGAPAEAQFWYGETLAKTKTPGASESYMKYLELEPHGYYADRAKKALAPR